MTQYLPLILTGVLLNAIAQLALKQGEPLLRGTADLYLGLRTNCQ